MQLRRLSILGVGLLGGSIGLAVRSAANHCQIIGYGHRGETLKRAQQIGAIDQAATDPVEAVQDAELVILCTPVGIFQSLLERIAPHLPAGAIVTDVGSTKRSIVQLAEKILPKPAHFVGSHPMAGSERRGIDFARTDLFQQALCITTPTDRTDRPALEKVEAFWRWIGMRITRLSPQEHDRLLADVSHLPHVLAAALIDMQPQQALDLAGKGFLDTTRIAGGDGGLWRDILLDNRDNLTDSIQRLKHSLDELQKLLSPNRGEALKHWLDTAATRREKLVQARLRDASE